MTLPEQLGSPRRRFQINPGPLRLTGPRVREEYQTDAPCEATTRDGAWCSRAACWVVTVPGREQKLCTQHLNAVARLGSVSYRPIVR